MRSIDPIIKTRLLQMQQTLYSNAQPSMDVYAIRPRTPIFHNRFWQESVIAPNINATSTSVALRKTGNKAERVYVAYISNNTLIVKSSALVFPVMNMDWQTEQTIDGCSACALVFDGSFVRVANSKVEYRTDYLPWLFYVTTDGQLMGGLLNDTFQNLGANVSSIDAIRGVASLYKDIDQGLVVFYIINGVVYYNQLINGAWQGQEMVSLAPANAVSVHAERTFDWRIALQVSDNAGALYEVFTKMTASGWNGHEYLTTGIAGTLQVTEIAYVNGYNSENLTVGVSTTVTPHYALSPVMKTASNFANIDGDYGYFIRLNFDELVFNTAGNEYNFTVKDAYNTVFHCVSITNHGRDLLLEFPNFNNANNPVTIEYTPGTVTGEVANMDADSLSITLIELVPYYIPSPVPVSVENIIDWWGVD